MAWQYNVISHWLGACKKISWGVMYCVFVVISKLYIKFQLSYGGAICKILLCWLYKGFGSTNNIMMKQLFNWSSMKYRFPLKITSVQLKKTHQHLADNHSPQLVKQSVFHSTGKEGCLFTSASIKPKGEVPHIDQLIAKIIFCHGYPCRISNCDLMIFLFHKICTTYRS